MEAVEVLPPLEQVEADNGVIVLSDDEDDQPEASCTLQ